MSTIEDLETRVKKLEVIVEEIDREKTDLVELNRQFEIKVSDLQSLERVNDQLNVKIRMLETQLRGMNETREGLREWLGLDLLEPDENMVESVVRRVMDSPNNNVNINVGQSDLVVEVHRETVTAEEASLRGMIGLLVGEGFFTKYKSARSVGRTLLQLGYKVTETSGSIIDELNWYTKQRIMIHDEKQGWMVKDARRVVVREK